MYSIYELLSLTSTCLLASVLTATIQPRYDATRVNTAAAAAAAAVRPVKPAAVAVASPATDSARDRKLNRPARRLYTHQLTTQLISRVLCVARCLCLLTDALMFLTRLSSYASEVTTVWRYRNYTIIIHAEHVVQSAWILFSLWMYVCMFVC